MKITTNLLEAISTSNGSVDDRENLLVAFDSMLESWVLFGISFSTHFVLLKNLIFTSWPWLTILVGDPLNSDHPLLSQEMLQICGKTIFELYVTARMNLVEMKLSNFDDPDVLEKINVYFFFFILNSFYPFFCHHSIKWIGLR